MPDINELNASYTYRNQPIESLWKLHYVVSNIGDKTIVGKGDGKHIIEDSIQFSFKKNFKILDLDFIDNHAFSLLENNGSKIFLSFSQWRQGESIELVMYIEQLNSAKKPILRTNDRDIINGEVRYSSFTNEITHNQEALFYKMPKVLQFFIKYLTIALSFLLVVVIPFAFLNESKKENISIANLVATTMILIVAIVSMLLLISW